MSIRIELAPQEEARLREQARQRGLRPEAVAADMVRSLLTPDDGPLTTVLAPVVDETGVFHPERWEEVLASVRAGSSSAPSLPREALTREAMYCDHD